jgi:hypothetical protein
LRLRDEGGKMQIHATRAAGGVISPVKSVAPLLRSWHMN